MTPVLRRWRMEMQRCLRLWRRKPEAAWPQVPRGIWLNPSDADFTAYERAPLILSWRNKGNLDVQQWQTQVRRKLTDLLGLTGREQTKVACIRGDSGIIGGGLKRQTFYIASGAHRHIPVTVIWDPATAAEKKPVMICLQGHTSGAHISWGEARLPADVRRIDNGGDYALQAVRHGHAAICVEQVAFGECREQALTHRWDHTCVDASNRALLLGHTLLGERVGDVLAVIDWMETAPADLPRLDIGKIRTMGNSAGGDTALFAATLDARVEGAIASGCVGDWRKTSGRRMTCPDTVIPGVLHWFEYSDVLALCAPRPLLVLSGLNDHLYPFHLAAECVEHARPVYATLSASDRLRAIAGPAGHRFYPDIAWPAFLELLHPGT